MLVPATGTAVTAAEAEVGLVAVGLAVVRDLGVGALAALGRAAVGPARGPEEGRVPRVGALAALGLVVLVVLADLVDVGQDPRVKGPV